MLRLVTATDPTALLRAAADGFLVRRPATESDPFPTVPYLLALRQGRLRDDLLDLAAAEKIPGWFDPPLCIFHELPEWLGVAERSVLGDYERAVIIGRILGEVGTEVFTKLPRPDAFVDGVDSLFGELIANDTSVDAFDRALAARTDRDDFEQRRDRDLLAAYRTYLDVLQKSGRGDGRDTWAYCAREIAAGRAALGKSLRGRRAIRIFGLADLRRGWRLLLDALASAESIDQVIVYSSSNLLDLGVGAEQLGEDTAAVAARVARRLFDDTAERVIADGKSVGQPTIISAPDVEREHDEVARRIRALIDGGAVPSRIAVVTRKARPHLDYAVAALGRFGVPAMARQRFTLSTIPAIGAIRTLFKTAADGWTRAGLVEIARQPYIACAMDARVINYIGYRRRVLGLEDWEKAFRALEQEAKRRDDRMAAKLDDAAPDERRSPPPPTDLVTATREAFGAFARHARALDAARSIEEWVDWLREMLARDTFGIRAGAYQLTDERFDIVRRDLAALDGGASIVDEWRSALSVTLSDAKDSGAAGGHGTTALVALHQFDEQLTAFLSGDAAIWTPACQGVQVMEAGAAAYRGLDHVFLVGMQAGSFPTQPGSSPILEESEREALASHGLPLDSRVVWEDREQELFRVLVAGAQQSLTLSYARLDELGRDVAASPFVEALSDVARCETVSLATSSVVIEGTPLAYGAEARDQAVHAATIERIRESGGLSRYNGAIESPELLAWLGEEFGDDRHWSPTQLEEFAKCPWAYFSKRALRLEALDDPDEDMDAATSGSILHLALRRFYDAAKSRQGGPVFLRAPDWEWAEPMLVEATDAAIAESDWKWLGHPTLREVTRAKLIRIVSGFVRWEIALHEDMHDPKTRKKAGKMLRMGADEHELAFDDMVFERDGVRIRYRGSIDRVDVTVDERVKNRRFVGAIDYKSTIYSTPGSGKPGAWADGVVLQVSLYAQALTMLRPDAEIARVEYQALKKPQQVHSLELYTIDKKTSVVTEDDEAAEKWNGALDHAIAHVKSIRAGRFPAEPPSSCNCPPWCHGRDICRVKGGPRGFRD